ncbi:MAG: TrkA C-terminal domain-containing protein [Actinomycetaceae bacterium]|nr:transporter [Arcanobacterium sp.]MDD7505196.1 TrkA C-terminal domain-containing protein [Actinomycetaceae bacterium]MDY6144069.1 TrkA C-terminal domain-containing protein [Arcanobacterium sp.]
METAFQYLASQPVLVLFGLIGIGMYIGHFRIKGIGLGAAAVLFLAIGISAWGTAEGVNMVEHFPQEFGILGLALFAFAIGINSGNSFFSSLKQSLGIMMMTLVVLIAGGVVAYLLGSAVGMDSAMIGGTFAGALTNTPALAAAGASSGDTQSATVAYSIAYLFGVFGMLIMATFALHYGKYDTDRPVTLISRTIRVEREDLPSVRDIRAHVHGNVRFSRLKEQEDGPTIYPTADTKLTKGALVTIVGPQNVVLEVISELGHNSSIALDADRSDWDYRRITISDPKLAGRTVGELALDERFQATLSRIRRGDTDMLAHADFVLQLGDRVRVVAPTKNMDKISKYFGDSSTGLTSINPVALGLGMVLGLLIGEFPILTPSGEYFTIGSAAGTLAVGLVFGKIGRIGPFPTALPYTACQVLSEFGLLVFLAQAGYNAGGQIAKAFTSGVWLSILLVGMAVTLTVGAGLYFVMRYWFKMGGTRLSGLLAGAQTQPAVLAYANNRTNFDPRVAIGYSLVYPAAMVGKILIAQVIGGL